MKHAGLVEQLKRGHYRLTPAGEALLNSNQEAINKDVLKTYPAFTSWFSKWLPEDASEVPVSSGSGPQEIAATPEEQIESAHASLNSALSEDLIEQLIAVTPARFEQVIVDLLIAMGYGSGRAEMGQALGKSGDGGIDGIINEDKLGLDAIYL